MKQNQQAMKQKEHEKKKRHRERALKLQRLLYLSNLDDREIDPLIEDEREALRVELWRGEQSHLRIVEVLYKGEVIFTGTRKDVCRKCKKLVEQWSKEKGLDKADSSKQMLKVVEETGEVAAALARNDQDALRDGIGDVVVTLIILAMQNDMDLYECLDFAYDEIKGRTGKMVNGVFVKSSDLK